MKTQYLKKLPKDVFDIVLQKQFEIKLRKGCNQFSFEATIYNIIREWKHLQDGKPKEVKE